MRWFLFDVVCVLLDVNCVYLSTPSFGHPSRGELLNVDFVGGEMRFVGGINKNGHRFVTMPVEMFGCVSSLSSCDEVECTSGFEPTDLLFIHGVF